MSCTGDYGKKCIWRLLVSEILVKNAFVIKSISIYAKSYTNRLNDTALLLKCYI